MNSYRFTELKFLFRRLYRRYALMFIHAAIAVGITGLVLTFSLSRFAERLDIRLMNVFYDIRGLKPAPKDIVIAAIDDETYRELAVPPRWPFPRKHSAGALERIVAAQPAALILDVKLAKEDLDPESDARIEAALTAGPTTMWSGEIPTSSTGGVGSKDFTTVTLPPDERFSKAVKMLLPMWNLSSQGYMYHMSVDLNPKSDPLSRIPIAKPLIELAKKDIIFPAPRDLINFYGPAGTIKRISLHSILSADKSFLEEAFRSVQ